MLLDYVIDNTKVYIEHMSKTERKKYGQFFTSKESAEYMSQLFNIQDLNGEIKILDPGSGSGILSAALLEHIQSNNKINEIQLTCYENDEKIINLLESNLNYLKQNLSVKLSYRIIKENYILSQSNDYSNSLFYDNKKNCKLL